MKPEEAGALSGGISGSDNWQPDTVDQHHAEVSRFLDELFSSPELRAVADRTLDALALSSGQAVLEVGCGNGVFLPLLARAVSPGGHVVGLDHAPSLVNEARSRVAAAGYEQSITLQEGNAYQLPFPDATFDAAHCERVLVHLDDPTAALREMRRVVRPGGRVVAAEPDFGGIRVDHPDRGAFDLIYARSLSRIRQPDIGLTLHRRFAEVGFEDAKVAPGPVTATDMAGIRILGVDLGPPATELVAEGLLSRERADAALAYLDMASRTGTFYSFRSGIYVANGRVA